MRMCVSVWREGTGSNSCRGPDHHRRPLLSLWKSDVSAQEDRTFFKTNQWTVNQLDLGNLISLNEWQNFLSTFFWET